MKGYEGLAQPFITISPSISASYVQSMKGEDLVPKFFRTQAHAPTQTASPRLRHGFSHSAKGMTADCQSDDSRLP